ncbi:hypothetical protein CL629_02245 [bacterium]|nr:hypothetical protein [bacterium]|tara:strand:- start:278 stop:622 length:345 start_codon:yes stop_codon:yes gene_type:complete
MQDFRTHLQKHEKFKRAYKLVDAGDYKLSIQANEAAYCSPRRVLDDVYGYESFEVVIKKFYGANSVWVHPSSIEGLDKRFDELFCSEDNIGGYMRVKDIQELYEFLSIGAFKTE